MLNGSKLRRAHSASRNFASHKDRVQHLLNNRAVRGGSDSESRTKHNASNGVRAVWRVGVEVRLSGNWRVWGNQGTNRRPVYFDSSLSRGLSRLFHFCGLELRRFGIAKYQKSCTQCHSKIVTQQHFFALSDTNIQYSYS
jgi:hypothetical protein